MRGVGYHSQIGDVVEYRNVPNADNGGAFVSGRARLFEINEKDCGLEYCLKDVDREFFVVIILPLRPRKDRPRP
jgi:hypothetical protein